MRADNKSYKDMYHFSKTNMKGWVYSPSLEKDKEVNTSIKENPYYSNVEVEKDEVVLKPDFSALFNVRGKTHKQGGTDVFLENNSFVFSNDPKLSFDKEDHKLMEFKEGGTKKMQNTPASVLKRNIDLKHYNKMTVNLQDEKKDDITKNSSVKMIEKYMDILGNVAYMQEAKKGFPDGLPFFSQETAPVYNQETKDAIMEQKQFRRGGRIKAQMGMSVPPWAWKYVKANTQDPSKKTAPSTGVSGVPAISGVPEDKVLPPGVRHVDLLKDEEEIIPTVNPAPMPPSVKNVQGYKTADWEFTPYQKENQAYNIWKWASAKRYMPYRSHLNPSFVEPQLVNPEQTISDLKGAYNGNLDSINSLSPILRNAQAADSFGQMLDRVPGIRSQFDNQNSAISNQARQYNNQIVNNARATNMQNDQNYYRESVVGQQNFDNLRSYLSDKYMSDRNQDIVDNQSLAYNMLTQNNPAYKYDWRTGRFMRTNKSILDVQTSPQSDLVSGLLGKLIPKFETLDPRVQSAVLRTAAIKGLPLNYKKGGMVNPY